MGVTNNINDEAIGEVEAKKKVNKIKGEYYQLPNVARAYDSEYYLTDIEMAVLVQIGVNVTAFETSITKTNVDMLNAELQVDKNLSRGRAKVSEAIVSLQQKGYFKVDCSGESIEDSALLTIHILHNLNGVTATQDGAKFTGYAPVTKKILSLAKQGKSNKFGQRLKVLTHIAWRSNIDEEKTKSKTKYSISFEEWKNVLNVVMSTAKSNIKKLEEEGIIEILHGEYKRNEDGTLYYAEDGRPRQERNTYFLKGEMPEVAEGYRPSAYKKHKRDAAIDKAIEKIMSEGEPRIADRPNLVMYGELPTVEDIELFLITPSETLEDEGRKKFAVLMNGKEQKKRDMARQILLKYEREVRSWFEGGNEDKIKRSIFNLGNDKLSVNEQEMTPDELKEKVDRFGYDNEYEEDEFAYDEVNSKEEKESIRQRAKYSINEDEEPKSIFDTPEWIERRRISAEESVEEDESDFNWEQEQEDIDSLPFA